MEPKLHDTQDGVILFDGTKWWILGSKDATDPKSEAMVWREIKFEEDGI